MLKRTPFLAILLLLCALPLSVGAAKSYTAERFDVDWNLTENGTLEVTETVVFRFAGGPFTYVYRELPRTTLMASRALPPASMASFCRQARKRAR